MNRRLIVAIALVAGAACSFDWARYEPPPPVTPATGGAGGTTDVGGGGTNGNPGGGGAGGEGGGGSAPVLVDRELLVRYYLDEAADGMDPMEVVDAAPNPLDLMLDYGDASAMGGAGGQGGAVPVVPNVSFMEQNGQRGLGWRAKNRSGRAAESIEGTKIQVLDGATAATTECVVRVEDAGGSSTCTRISHVGINSFGSFTWCSNGQTISVGLNGQEAEEWEVEHDALGRIVIHGVLDTTEPEPSDRLRLYIDGVDQGAGTLDELPPDAMSTITIPNGLYVIGNRNNNNASLGGHIYYCALYNTALTADEVAQNAAILLVDDDTPSPR